MHASLQDRVPSTAECVSAAAWAPGLVPLLTRALDAARGRHFAMLSSAYSRISTKDVAAELGLSEADTAAMCAQGGWLREGAEVWLPRAAPRPAESRPPVGVLQLEQLTDYVVHLEKLSYRAPAAPATGGADDF